jgi:parvulin-like peptidyl-prolyl isomerase
MTANLRLGLHAAVCAAGLLYLAGDFWGFEGPVKHWLTGFRPDSPRSIAKAKASDVVARVRFHPITRSQLDRAVKERLWLRGLDATEVSASDLPAIRRAALDDLIDELLLRIEANERGVDAQVTEAEIDHAFQQFAARFAEGELDTALREQGLTRAEWRHRLAAKLEQEKALEQCIGETGSIDETEARDWFARHAGELEQPERLQARHVFLATLERKPDEAKRLLDRVLADFAAGKKDFAALALEWSDDEASKAKGGELGWLVRRDRLPADFAAAVFRLPERVPSLIRTSLGWHLVEVTAKQPAKARAFEDARGEIVASLVSQKRQKALAVFRAALRAREAERIEVWLEE